MHRTTVRVTAAVLIGGLLLLGCSGNGSESAPTTTVAPTTVALTQHGRFCQSVILLGTQVPAIFEKKVRVDADVEPFKARIRTVVDTMGVLAANNPPEVRSEVEQLQATMQLLLADAEKVDTATEVQEVLLSKVRQLSKNATFRLGLQDLLTYVSSNCP